MPRKGVRALGNIGKIFEDLQILEKKQVGSQKL